MELRSAEPSTSDPLLKERSLVDGRFSITRRLTETPKYDIYAGVNTINGHEVAFKVAKVTTNRKRLRQEMKYYRMLDKGPGIPSAWWLGEWDKRQFLVLDLLGPTLTDQLSAGRHFSASEASGIGKQLVTSLHWMHARNIIHRDIKPGNIAVGPNNQVHLFDYELSAEIDPHKSTLDSLSTPPVLDRHFMGSILYASCHIHHGLEPQKRDDLISTGYLLIQLHSVLPWSQGALSYEEIVARKTSTSLEELCKAVPRAMLDYMGEVCGLGFFEHPKYSLLINILEQMKAEGETETSWEIDICGNVY